MNDGFFPLDDLSLVTDSYLVEHIGGPNDGEFLPVNTNGLRRNGLYVPVNDANNRCVALRYVPREAWQA